MLFIKLFKKMQTNTKYSRLSMQCNKKRVYFC